MNFRLIFYIIGLVSSVFGVVMLIPALVDFCSGSANWKAFFIASASTLFPSIIIILATNSQGRQDLRVREGFLGAALVWISICIVGALPFYFSDLHMDITDAFFESTSGITTTGATVISGLDSLVSNGLILWRAILHWLGGIGIVVLAIAILPMLKIGGMQHFKAESFDPRERMLPKASTVASYVFAVYCCITIIAIIALMLTGIGFFDSLVHSMAAVSTGGFSSHDASIGYFKNPAVEIILTVEMFCSSLPFVLYFFLGYGRFKNFFANSQVKTFTIFILIYTLIFFAVQMYQPQIMSEQAKYMGSNPDSWFALRQALFTVVSIASGTGYVTVDYAAWGPISHVLILIVLLIGGCTGSAAGGIKIFRIEILIQVLKIQFRKLIHPFGIFTHHYQNKVIHDDIIQSIATFFFVYLASWLLIALCLSLTNFDLAAALSTAAIALANCGPMFGKIAGQDYTPISNFQNATDAGKWITSFAMLLGRLEFYTFLVLLSPRFWRGN